MFRRNVLYTYALSFLLMSVPEATVPGSGGTVLGLSAQSSRDTRRGYEKRLVVRSYIGSLYLLSLRHETSPITVVTLKKTLFRHHSVYKDD